MIRLTNAFSDNQKARIQTLVEGGYIKPPVVGVKFECGAVDFHYAIDSLLAGCRVSTVCHRCGVLHWADFYPTKSQQAWLEKRKQ